MSRIALMVVGCPRKQLGLLGCLDHQGNAGMMSHGGHVDWKMGMDG